MADFDHGTQFSDLPSCLAIHILLRLPLKTLLICRYVRKDWTRLYFSDPYFIRRQLAASDTQILYRNLINQRKLRFGCVIDEVNTGNLRLETLELSCKLVHDHPKYQWRVVNSCNGLLFLVDESEYPYDADPCSIVYVCNPILGEWVSIPFPYRNGFYGSLCALGFSGNYYKILSHNYRYTRKECEWQIYTLGTGHWRSIETDETTEPWRDGLDFNTFIHGSLHWIGYSKTDEAYVVQAFNFETERFTVFSLPKIESSCIVDRMCPRRWALGVINGCLWASFYFSDHNCTCDGEMWAMKEYGNEKSWSMMVALRNHFREYDPPDDVLRARYKELVIYKDGIGDHRLLFSLNGELMLTSSFGAVCYNITTGNRPRELREGHGILLYMTDIGSVAYNLSYNPSFVSLHDVGRGEEVIRL